MRRFLTIAMKLALLLFVVVTIYSVIVVFRSRFITETLVEAKISSSQIALQLSDFPEDWLDLLVAVEDPNFYSHTGLEYSALFEQPGTITQRLVRSLYFEYEEPRLEMLEELLIARFSLHPLLSKEKQLLIFVNTVSFGCENGREIRGFARASEVFLDKPFRRLSRREYLSLLAMLSSPETLHPTNHQEANNRRVEEIRQLTANRM
jgi:membrane peptidoglycan carboxypeptidase